MSDTITQFGKFQHGADAGIALAKLFKELGTNIEDLEKPTDEELETIFRFIWAQNTIDRPYQSVMGFLSTILRRKGYSGEIMRVLGTSELIKAQREYAPMSTLPENSGLIMFGWWTGDLGDGDAWCLDIRADRICCVPVGSPETLDEARIGAYGTFHDFHYLEAFLRRSAELRGWLPNR
jgi:hypothetical protein